jgi:hypothetical protein
MIVEEEGFWKRWAHRLFGPHQGEPPPPPTREELVEALAQVDRQLEILRGGPHYSKSYARVSFQSEIAELESVRTGLAQCLSDLGPDNPAAP